MGEVRIAGDGTGAGQHGSSETAHRLEVGELLTLRRIGGTTLTMIEAEVVDRQRNLLSALVRFGQGVDSEPELHLLLQRAVVLSVRALAVSHGKLMCYRPDHGDLLLVAGVGWRPHLVGNLTLAIDSGSPPGRALHTGQPVVVSNFGDHTALRHPAILREHGVVAAMNVPVEVDGKVWGVLEVDHTVEREFTSEEVEFLTAMALLVARPIRRDKTQQRLREFEAGAAKVRAHYETLMSEVDHRVKNNLQVINSILALEQKRIRDPVTRRVFQNVMDRVTAVAIAHDQLSTIPAGEQLNLAMYLGAVCSSLDKEFAERLAITTSLQNLYVSPAKAVPVGLILNEAVTNAAKYAYPEGESGPVAVSLALDHEMQEARLEIRDSGVGLPKRSGGGHGGHLMEALARQLGGYVERDAPGVGTLVRLLFPVGS